MNLEEFTRQLESMHRRFMQLSPTDESHLGEFQSMWVETSEALGVTVEELRVVGEELRSQNDELQESRSSVEEERRRYRDLFDFAPDGYLVTDLHGVIRDANRVAGELLKTSPRFLAGKPLANYVAMEQRLSFRGGLNRLLRVGRRDGWTVRLRPKHGEPFDATITAAVARDWDGSPTGLRWMIRDARAAGFERPGGVTGGPAIEEANGEAVGTDGGPQAEHAKDEAEALRGLVQGLDLIVWEADARSGRCWYISPRAEKLLGHPVESWTEDVGFWDEIIHADDRPMASSHRARCLREGRGGELEYRLIAADGRVVWVREWMAVERDELGRPSVARGCLWDISRRKKVERQLYTDRRKLAEHVSDVWHLYLLGGQLLANLEMGPVLEEILSAVTSLLGAEMGALRLLDRERDELDAVASLGLPPEYLERHGRMAVGEAGCGEAAARGEAVVVEDIRAAEASGGPVAAGRSEAARLGGFRAFFSVPLISRRGEVLGTVSAFFREPHRPSERQIHLVSQYVLQAADALENASRHRDSREADRRKEEFLATLAHELRNPLVAILTSANLLQPGALDARTLGEARAMIVRQARHMARLVEDLLDATRVSRGTIRLRREAVALADVVAKAVEDVRPLVDARRQELALTMPEPPIVLEADPMRLEQVISNLLTNAAKYTDPGGRIELAASREGDEAVIRVRDDGIGIEPEAQARLFRLFSQADAAYDRSRGGLGIGLALVKNLVELHGGSVRAASGGPGLGSEFTVRLPLG